MEEFDKAKQHLLLVNASEIPEEEFLKDLAKSASERSRKRDKSIIPAQEDCFNPTPPSMMQLSIPETRSKEELRQSLKEQGLKFSGDD